MGGASREPGVDSVRARQDSTCGDRQHRQHHKAVLSRRRPGDFIGGKRPIV